MNLLAAVSVNIVTNDLLFHKYLTYITYTFLWRYVDKKEKKEQTISNTVTCKGA